ncbi:MAG: hypothetical protein IJ047_00595 [Paludibacteraceae bacterium]|nr:hypothetical protein [Paludibacteraceae bacterium]
MLFNENGILNIDEAISNNPSFKKIMEDGIVTNEELNEQSHKLIDLLQQAEKQFSAEELQLLEQILVESNVLYAVYQKYQLQNI